MKKTICLIYFVFLTNIVNAQCGNDFKYLMAIMFIKNDSTLKKEVVDFFFSKKSKVCDLSFNVCKDVEFIDLRPIYKLIDTSYISLPNNLINSQEDYKKNYYFETYTSPFLKNLNIKSKYPLYLIFSEPIDNYLIAELSTYDPMLRERKMGLGLRIVLKFNNLGVVDYFVTSRIIYN